MGKTYRKDYYEDDPNHKTKASRDKKKTYKPGKALKEITKRQERARKKDFIRHIDDYDYDDLIPPKFKKHNDYDYN